MLQPNRSLAENLADLPTACNVGCKRNSQGYQESWTGYKFHLDCADGDIPVSAILTSASLHDSQAAIPLAQLTAERVNSNLKDNFGGLFDRVRGPDKVMAHLMFGLLALTATQLFNLLL